MAKAPDAASRDNMSRRVGVSILDLDKTKLVVQLIDHDIETTITMPYLRELLMYGFVGYMNMRTIDLIEKSRQLGLFDAEGAA